MDVQNEIIIKDKLIQLVCNVLGEDVSKADIENSDDLSEHGLNSLGMVKVVIGIESVFGIALDEDNLMLSNFKSIEKMKECILTSLNTKTAIRPTVE